jgi:hypothetical protein
MAGVVFAVATTYATDTILIREGEPWAADDPLVVGKPELFTSNPDRYVRRSAPPPVAVVESATAEPGELRRGPGRPRKDGNGPWAPNGGDVA